jgi:hypothetical protein
MKETNVASTSTTPIQIFSKAEIPKIQLIIGDPAVSSAYFSTEYTLIESHDNFLLQGASTQIP